MSNPRKKPKRTSTTLSGHWDIIHMDEFDEAYFQVGDDEPYLTLTRSGTDDVRGEYAIGLSTGSLDGALHALGDATILNLLSKAPWVT